MLKRYKYRKFGSIYYNYLGFGLKNDWDYVRDHAWLYVSILSKDRSFKIVVRIDTQEVTSKLQGEDLEKFVSFVNLLKGFRALIGSKRELVDLSKRLLEYKSGKLETADFFDGDLKLEKRFSFKDVQEELGLNTPMFPQNLMKEIMELKPIITLMNQVLTDK